VILVENPSTRSFVVAQDSPTRGQAPQLEKGSLTRAGVTLKIAAVHHLVSATRSPYGLGVFGDAIARARAEW
jgi:hypothetical protein